MISDAPKIYVELKPAGPSYYSRPVLAKAHIRERVKGPNVFRYLVWRPNPQQVTEFYIGKVALQNPGTSEALKNKYRRKQIDLLDEERSRSQSTCRVKKGGKYGRSTQRA